MKKPLYISLIVLLAQSAFPSIVAYDTAADATYNGGAYNGLNGGYGFQSWIVNTGGGGSGGSFLYTSSSNGGAPSGSIDTGGRSFGLYANGGNTTFASRYFARSTPLTSGYTIEADFDNGWIENGDSDAIGLLGGSATPRLIFYGGDNQYRFIDEAGNYHATGLGFTDGGVHVSFDLTSMGYDFKATRLADNSTYSYSSSKGLSWRAAPGDGLLRSVPAGVSRKLPACSMATRMVSSASLMSSGTRSRVYAPISR